MTLMQLTDTKFDQSEMQAGSTCQYLRINNAA